jgi:hypothetical protein
LLFFFVVPQKISAKELKHAAPSLPELNPFNLVYVFNSNPFTPAMKKLFVLILICVSAATYSQNDTIFPNQTAEWHVKVYTEDEGSTYYGNHTVKLSDDSTFSAGLWWHSVLNGIDDTVGLAAIDSGLVYYQSTAVMALGLLHTYYDPAINILYDFNLTIGDTAYIDDTDPAIVIDTTTSLILGAPRKSFLLNNGDEVIHGLGSFTGFFRPFMSTFELGIGMCHFEGNYIDSLLNQYTLDYTISGGCTAGLDGSTGLHLIIYPNPSMDFLKVETQSQSPIVYSVHDIHGRQFMSGTSNEPTFQLEINKLDKGTYVLSVLNEKRLFIVQ